MHHLAAKGCCSAHASLTIIMCRRRRRRPSRVMLLPPLWVVDNTENRFSLPQNSAHPTMTPREFTQDL